MLHFLLLFFFFLSFFSLFSLFFSLFLSFSLFLFSLSTFPSLSSLTHPSLPSLAGDPNLRRHLQPSFDVGILPLPSRFALADHRTLISCGHWDCSVRLTSIDTGKTIQVKYLEDTVTCVALSSDWSVLATGTMSGGLQMWEMRGGRIGEGVRGGLVGHDFPISMIAISAPGDVRRGRNNMGRE